VVAIGRVGNGFPEASLPTAFDKAPHLWGGDGGLCDPSPYYIALDIMFDDSELSEEVKRSGAMPCELSVPVPCSARGSLVHHQ